MEECDAGADGESGFGEIVGEYTEVLYAKGRRYLGV
jgi:hypothetical protein